MRNLITFVALTLCAWSFWAGICVESNRLAYQLVSSAVGGATLIVYYRINVHFVWSIFAMLTPFGIAVFVDSDRLAWALYGIAIIGTFSAIAGTALRRTQP